MFCIFQFSSISRESSSQDYDSININLLVEEDYKYY